GPGATGPARNVAPDSQGTPPAVTIRAEPITPALPTDVPNNVIKKDGPRMTLAQIQRRIQDACPKAMKVLASQRPAGEVKVEIHVREDGDIDAILNRIYALPEMESYRLEVSFVVGNPGKM